MNTNVISVSVKKLFVHLLKEFQFQKHIV